MSQKAFDAQVDAWVLETKKRLLAVFQVATQNLFFEVIKPVGAGGRMRVDTGFLRASFRASLDAPILQNNPNPGGVSYTADTGAISLTINQAEIGQTIYGMFTANYARPREYGSRGRPGDGFVMTNAARWQDFVNEAIIEVRTVAAVQ